MPYSYDSSGVLRTLSLGISPSWIPMLDTRPMRAGKQDHYWPVGIMGNNFMCVICKVILTKLFWAVGFVYNMMFLLGQRQNTSLPQTNHQWNPIVDSILKYFIWTIWRTWRKVSIHFVSFPLPILNLKFPLGTSARLSSCNTIRIVQVWNPMMSKWRTVSNGDWN